MTISISRLSLVEERGRSSFVRAPQECQEKDEAKLRVISFSFCFALFPYVLV